jgi:autotransporter family porin
VGDAQSSTAYNVDVSLAARRNCFEGNETWLNTVDRGRDYAAGDLWGCVGMWFSGRWYTQPAVDYIAAVQDWLNQRIWETPDFLGYG